MQAIKYNDFSGQDDAAADADVTARGSRLAGAWDAAVSPEAVLSLIFNQALAGEALRLPAGVGKADLRAALALEPEVMGRIYAAARANHRPPQPDLLPASLRLPSRKSLLAAFGGLALLALLLGVFAWPANEDVAALNARAGTNPGALAMLAQRAAKPDPEAAFDLATLMDSQLRKDETTVPKDDVLAVSWYQRAAEAGFAPAENNLAHAFETGQGVPQDLGQAVHWYQAAATAELPNAENALGYLYQTGQGVPQNDVTAVQWYQRAAFQDFAPGETNLGAALETGRGIRQNDALAVHWLAKAAAQGFAPAENRLGFLTFRGRGTAADAAAGCALFAQAAAQNLAEAQVNLGLCYARGEGLAPDRVQAAKWFLLARQAGDKDAPMAMAQFEPPLSTAELAAAQVAAQLWHP